MSAEYVINILYFRVRICLVFVKDVARKEKLYDKTVGLIEV